MEALCQLSYSPERERNCTDGGWSITTVAHDGDGRPTRAACYCCACHATVGTSLYSRSIS
jgi:hypothetical protein